MHAPELLLRQASAQTSAQTGSIRKIAPQRKFLDWTSKELPADYPLTPFQRFTRDVDWENSPLGPMEGWSSQLRQAVLTLMADPDPAIVFWGERMTLVYNEVYPDLIGNKHPGSQGQDPWVWFAEIRDPFEKIIKTV
jgi:hypothetical protein